MFLIIDKSKGLEITPDLSLNSLTAIQAASIEQALEDGWSVDRHVTYDESLALLVSPLDPAVAETVFYVEAASVGLNLSIMRNDNLRFQGCYGSIAALLAAIRSIPQS